MMHGNTISARYTQARVQHVDQVPSRGDDVPPGDDVPALSAARGFNADEFEVCVPSAIADLECALCTATGMPPYRLPRLASDCLAKLNALHQLACRWRQSLASAALGLQRRSSWTAADEVRPALTRALAEARTSLDALVAAHAEGRIFDGTGRNGIRTASQVLREAFRAIRTLLSPAYARPTGIAPWLERITESGADRLARPVAVLRRQLANIQTVAYPSSRLIRGRSAPEGAPLVDQLVASYLPLPALAALRQTCRAQVEVARQALYERSKAVWRCDLEDIRRLIRHNETRHMVLLDRRAMARLDDLELLPLLDDHETALIVFNDPTLLAKAAAAAKLVERQAVPGELLFSQWDVIAAKHPHGPDSGVCSLVGNREFMLSVCQSDALSGLDQGFFVRSRSNLAFFRALSQVVPRLTLGDAALPDSHPSLNLLNGILAYARTEWSDGAAS